jgi:hypothetical protein
LVIGKILEMLRKTEAEKRKDNIHMGYKDTLEITQSLFYLTTVFRHFPPPLRYAFVQSTERPSLQQKCTSHDYANGLKDKPTGSDKLWLSY